MELFGSLVEMSSLSCVYFAMLSVGVMYALVILVAGGLHDFGVDVDLGADVDVGGDLHLGGADVHFGGDALHGSVEVASISPVTLAGFVTAFGAFGIIGQSIFSASGPASLVWASVGGVVVGLVSHLAFIYFFIKPQGSSEVTRADIVGRTAEVITPIPATSVGEIALVAKGARVTLTARSAGRTPIERGIAVTVEGVVGSVALVRPLPEDSSTDASETGA
jgi:hypothetical protein